MAGMAAAYAGGRCGDGRLATVGPSGWQVGLVAMLQIGVTAALTAAAANWLILRRTTPRRPRSRPHEEAPHAPEPAPAAGIPAGVIDETDDAGGHRIYLNPWARHDDHHDPHELDELDDDLPPVLQ